MPRKHWNGNDMLRQVSSNPQFQLSNKNKQNKICKQTEEQRWNRGIYVSLPHLTELRIKNHWNHAISISSSVKQLQFARRKRAESLPAEDSPNKLPIEKTREIVHIIQAGGKWISPSTHSRTRLWLNKTEPDWCSDKDSREGTAVIGS